MNTFIILLQSAIFLFVVVATAQINIVLSILLALLGIRVVLSSVIQPMR